jgi:eukaryotic-like serine/threonine-protein kinase
MSLASGTRLGPYEVLGLIGAGGMGEVYKARDMRLDRTVAIKTLPEALTGHEHRARFEREAKTVASLNHPHIVTLYSVEEAAGVRFLTMELVEGQGLDRVLTVAGLPLEKVFAIGIAIADALAAAHEKGIVHRDLKPANVMLARDGHVKVLDFGLARPAQKFAWDQTVTELALITTEGAMMGRFPACPPSNSGVSPWTTEAISSRSGSFCMRWPRDGGRSAEPPLPMSCHPSFAIRPGP